MRRSHIPHCLVGCMSVLMVTVAGGFAAGQSSRNFSADARRGDESVSSPRLSYRLAQNPVASPSGTSQRPTTIPQGHPLTPALTMARASLERMSRIPDYSCVFIKRERIEGRLGGHEYMFIKVRHEPFSIYLYCMGPQKPRGQEAIYVHGQNDNLVLAHTVGLKDRIAGMRKLDPNHPRMIDGNLYPITNIGMRNLLTKLIRLYERETRFGECQVSVLKGAKVEQRSCTCVQVVHPVPRRDFKFYVSRVYYDDEWQIPIRFEAHSWPASAGGDPKLVEEYTYTKLRFNPRLADHDFSATNSEYSFH